MRYYVVTAPATLPAVLASVGFGWHGRRGRPWLVTAAACSVCGVTVTAYLIQTANMKLFFSTQPLTTVERKRLSRTWYWVNVVKLIAASGAWLAAHKAKTRLIRSGE